MADQKNITSIATGTDVAAVAASTPMKAEMHNKILARIQEELNGDS